MPCRTSVSRSSVPGSRPLVAAGQFFSRSVWIAIRREKAFSRWLATDTRGAGSHHYVAPDQRCDIVIDATSERAVWSVPEALFTRDSGSS